ncbi:hypothetical protein BFG07_07385 [Kosakonia cowanii]|uniref:hypothetical protein n=1 Tax=Kosakonia cowanii TaxID=208223 RepID=UPI000B966B71|nr:hypothetical protein [Kosakonia cowanii]AST68513.1 hypothetical protein BFG07_07385 [Kosakonia cowanii]
MEINRSHGRAPTPGHEDIALRSRTAASTSAAAGVDPTQAARLQEIARIERTLETESVGGAEVREHMHGVAVRLAEMGETADDVATVIQNARKNDKGTSALAEAAMGLAYGLSGMPGDLAGKALAQKLNLEPGTPGHDFVTGLTGGLTAVAFKAVVSKLVDNSLKDGKWMQADKEALEPFMQEVMKRHESTGHKVKNAALGGSGYNMRNPVTAAISAGTQKLAENAPSTKPVEILKGIGKPGYLINQGAGLLLTTGAGAASGVVQNQFDHLHGAEYLFGRHDWQERYMALASGRKHSAEGGRFDALKNNLTTPKNWGKAVLNLVALSQLVEGFALGGGLGLANMSKSAASKAMASSMSKGLGSVDNVMKNSTNRAIRELAGQGAYIPVAAVAYFSQGAAAIAYDAMKKAAKNALGLGDGSSTSSSSSSTNTDTTDGSAHLTSGERTPEGTSASVSGTEARASTASPAPEAGTEARASTESPAPEVSTEARASTASPAPEVGTEARASTASPAPEAGTEARASTASPAPEAGTEARASTASPAPEVSTEARASTASPAPEAGTEARASTETPAAIAGTRTKTPSEASRPDSASVHSKASDALPKTPSEYLHALLEEMDPQELLRAFPEREDILTPRPERITPAMFAAIIEHLEAEAEKMSERIAEMIPLPDSLPTSSASSVASGPSASSEAAAPAGSPEPEAAKSSEAAAPAGSPKSEAAKSSEATAPAGSPAPEEAKKAS